MLNTRSRPTPSSSHNDCYSERRDTGVHMREVFALTLYQKIALYERGFNSLHWRKGKNTPGSVLKYSISTVFLLTRRIPVTVNCEPRTWKAGGCGRWSTWLWWFLVTQSLLESPPQQQAQPWQGRSQGKRENDEEKKKRTSWVSWVWSCSKSRSEEPVIVTVSVPILALGRSHPAPTHPHTLRSGAQSSPRDSFVPEARSVSQRDFFVVVHLLLRKLRHIPGLFYCSYNDKLHVNVWKATFCTVLFHTDNVFEKLSKCINNLPLSPLQEVSRYSEKSAS